MAKASRRGWEKLLRSLPTGAETPGKGWMGDQCVLVELLFAGAFGEHHISPPKTWALLGQHIVKKPGFTLEVHACLVLVRQPAGIRRGPTFQVTLPFPDRSLPFCCIPLPLASAKRLLRSERRLVPGLDSKLRQLLPLQNERASVFGVPNPPPKEGKRKKPRWKSGCAFERGVPWSLKSVPTRVLQRP